MHVVCVFIIKTYFYINYNIQSQIPYFQRFDSQIEKLV